MLRRYGTSLQVVARLCRRYGAAESVVNGSRTPDGRRISAFFVGADNVTIDGFLDSGQTTLGDVGAG